MGPAAPLACLYNPLQLLLVFILIAISPSVADAYLVFKTTQRTPTPVDSREYPHFKVLLSFELYDTHLALGSSESENWYLCGVVPFKF